jgi:hypothetical protein
MPTPRFDTTVLDTAALIAIALAGGEVPAPAPRPQMEQEDLAGVWLSADGTVRLHLRPEGSYVRGISGRRRSAHGTYLIDGPCVLLRDDNGLRTVVTVTEDVLEMAGHRLARRR